MLVLPRVLHNRAPSEFLDFPFDENLRRLEDYDFGIRFGLGGGELVVLDVIGTVVERSKITDLNQVQDAGMLGSMTGSAAI